MQMLEKKIYDIAHECDGTRVFNTSCVSGSARRFQPSRAFVDVGSFTFAPVVLFPHIFPSEHTQTVSERAEAPPACAPGVGFYSPVDPAHEKIGGGGGGGVGGGGGGNTRGLVALQPQLRQRFCSD